MYLHASRPVAMECSLKCRGCLDYFPGLPSGLNLSVKDGDLVSLFRAF
jgi:hypothetical protein